MTHFSVPNKEARCSECGSPPWMHHKKGCSKPAPRIGYKGQYLDQSAWSRYTDQELAAAARKDYTSYIQSNDPSYIKPPKNPSYIKPPLPYEQPPQSTEKYQYYSSNSTGSPYMSLDPTADYLPEVEEAFLIWYPAHMGLDDDLDEKEIKEALEEFVQILKETENGK